MFIAHIPSGYIMSKYILDRARHIPVAATALFMAGIIGAVAPDFDMIYFYLIDHRQTNHHRYISHWPILWLSLVVVSYLLLRYTKRQREAFLAMTFSLGGMLHLILDSFAGVIWWFAPFLDRPYTILSVVARTQPWWLNFILHGSFVLELLICVWALILYRNSSSRVLPADKILDA